MDWFLYDNGLRYERVKGEPQTSTIIQLSMQSSHLLEDLKSMLHLLWEYSGFNIAQTTELGDTVF